MNRGHGFSLLASLALVGVSCGDDEGGTTQTRGVAAHGGGERAGGPPPTPPPTPPGAPPAPGASPAAAATPPTDPHEEGDYAPIEFDVRRDPFRGPWDEGPKRLITAEAAQVLPLTELQQHQLNQLALKGIITGTGLSGVALVIGRGTKSHIVRIGDKIGPPPGRVIQILSDRIIVERVVTGPDAIDGTRPVNTRLLSEIVLKKRDED